jgi:hypothetical protein
MKKYLAIYLGSEKSFTKWKMLDEATRKKDEKAGMEGWMKWAKKYEKSIVDDGAPLGKTKKVDMSGISDIKNEMGAYTVVEATSHEEAAKMFLDHPHFTLFPGESIEIMECLPIPTI